MDIRNAYIWVLDYIQPLADQSCYIPNTRDSRPFGYVIQRPAKPNCFMSNMTNRKPKTGIEQNAIQHNLNRNLVRFYGLYEFASKLEIQNPEPHCV